MAIGDAVELPQHFFKALCQNPECRVLLGGFHIPSPNGLVAYVCGKCSRTSVFKNEAYGIRAALAGPLKIPDATAAATPPLRRGR